MNEFFTWIICSGLNKKGNEYCTCNKKLLRGSFQPGTEIEIKCPRCSTINERKRSWDFEDKKWLS